MKMLYAAAGVFVILGIVIMLYMGRGNKKDKPGQGEPPDDRYPLW